MDDKELKALITLLDDNDDFIFEAVEKKLLQKGIHIVPELEKAWENSFNEKLHTRLEAIIEKIQFTDTHKQLNDWYISGAHDLLTGIFLIAKYQYPDLEYKAIRHQLENIKDDVWFGKKDNLTALEQIRAVNHVIYDIHKFSGNNANFYAPQNSYLNHVLETKRGNPILLAIIYIIIVRWLDVPVFGVNLPKNFILAFTKQDKSLEQNYVEKDILFYINPFNRGNVLGRREIEHFLQQQQLQAQDSYFLPCDNITIIQRVILNLVYAYEKNGYSRKIKDLQRLGKIFDKRLPGTEKW